MMQAKQLLDYWNNLWEDDFAQYCDPEDEDSNEVIDHAEIEEQLTNVKDGMLSDDLIKAIVRNCEKMADDIVHYAMGDMSYADVITPEFAKWSKKYGRGYKRTNDTGDW